MQVTEEQRYLVALDLDGTVVQRGGVIDDELREAIRSIERAGHQVVISTGRSVDSALPVIGQLGITPEWIVACNGAMTLKRDPLGDRGYRHEFVETFSPREVLTRIHAHLISSVYGVETADGELLYTDDIPATTLPSRRRHVTFEEMLNTQATRLLIISPSTALERYLAVVDAMGLTRITYGINDIVWLDIAPAGVDKQSALEAVRARLGIDRSRVFAAGDGHNDVAMLQWADRHGDAVAMGHAPDEVKAAAGRVTGAVHEGGLYSALKYRFPKELGFLDAEPGDLS